MLLTILFWVILVLAVVGLFVPVDYWPVRVNNVVVLALFIIVGLRLFRTSV